MCELDRDLAWQWMAETESMCRAACRKDGHMDEDCLQFVRQTLFYVMKVQLSDVESHSLCQCEMSVLASRRDSR